MGKRDAWLKIFPLPQVSKAVDVLTEGWHELANHPKPNFNHETHEPDLTLVLTQYLRDVLGYQRKLLGSWTAEENCGVIDYTTGKIFKRTRTDVQYRWNDTKENYSVIFEFKKLDSGERSRKHYYGENGMQRFVTGTYGIKHPLAFMAGILVEDWSNCVPPLRERLQTPAIASSLQMCTIKNQLLQTPSALFPSNAAFDTEHLRDRPSAPAHGTIRISHLFLQFGYSSAKRSRQKIRHKSRDPLGS
jgi:hypothetical protein